MTLRACPLLLVFLSPALAQPATPQEPTAPEVTSAKDIQRLKQAVRSRASRFLKGRSLYRMASEDRKTGEFSFRESKIRRHWQKYIPGRLKKSAGKAFSPKFHRGSGAILDDPEIKSIFIHRDCAVVEWTATRIGFERAYPGQRQTKRKIDIFDVWTRQGGKFVLARREGKKQIDAVSGEQLLQHPWFTPKTVGVNEAKVRGLERGNQPKATKGEDDDLTELQKKRLRKKRRKKPKKKSKAVGEVADVGIITAVKEETRWRGKRGREQETFIVVHVQANWYVCAVEIALKESQDREAFYVELSKGTEVVFRAPYAYDYRGSPQLLPRTDGQPTVERFEPTTDDSSNTR